MALLAKDPTTPLQPAELPAMRVLLSVLGCALAVFATITLLVHWQVTNHVDRALLDTLAAPHGSWAAETAVGVTALGDTVPVLTILVVAGVLAPVRWGGGWRLLLLPWASAAVAFLCASVIKDVMARARPPESGWASPARGFAFPSGHTATSTAGYLVLALLVSGLTPMARHRRHVLAGGLAIALLVGASRVVLGVHWPTDVIAGWALGAAVAAAALAVTRSASMPTPGSSQAQELPQ
jgi:undecaprenyl-diphosphatase